jgi:hypothetical protein
MNMPNVIGYCEDDAKRILKIKGFFTTSVYYNDYDLKHYNKSDKYRVVRQKKINNKIHLLLVHQCVLS